MVLGHQWVKKKVLGCHHSRSFRERGCFAPSPFTNEQEPDWFGASPPECKGPRIAPEPLTAAGVHPASDRHSVSYFGGCSSLPMDLLCRPNELPYKTARRILFPEAPYNPVTAPGKLTRSTTERSR